MRKFVSLCLLIALVCSLCATGVSASALSSEELLEKYGALIDAIEADDYDAAADAFDLFFAAPADEEEEDEEEEEAGVETIELNADNFLDYYEWVYLKDGYVERNSSGKIKSLSAGRYAFVLKDEYKDRYSYESSEITVGVIAKLSSIYRAKINWETGAIKRGDKVSKDMKKAIKKDCSYATAKLDTQVTGYDSIYVCHAHLFYLYSSSGYKWWFCDYSAEAGGKTKYYIDTWKADVVNVSGTLVLNPAA